jgi:hypothetical protein
MGMLQGAQFGYQQPDDNAAAILVKLRAREREIERQLASVDALRAELAQVRAMLNASGGVR